MTVRAGLHLSPRLETDLIARRFFRADKEVRLGPREFDLLAALMRNRGAVLTRDVLLAQVWGEGGQARDRSVDNQVHALRQKIELDPATPTRITTVRGVGYRFEG